MDEQGSVWIEALRRTLLLALLLILPLAVFWLLLRTGRMLTASDAGT